MNGPSLHEILHAWANFAVPMAVGAHWRFSSANGQPAYKPHSRLRKS